MPIRPADVALSALEHPGGEVDGRLVRGRGQQLPGVLVGGDFSPTPTGPEARVASLFFVARWELGEKLGWGRFGLVYACRCDEDPEGEHPWAHKKLQTDMAQSEEVRKRFAREIEILASLDHENVMPVVDTGETGKGIPWFVMPKADGGSLKDAIEDGRINDRSWVIGSSPAP